MEGPKIPRTTCYDEEADPTRAVLYARSSEPVTVLQRLRHVIEDRPGQHDVVAEHHDPKFTEHGDSRDFTERPGLHRVLAAVAREEVDLLAVERLEHLVDHFSTLGHLLRLLDAHDVDLVVLAQGIDTTRPESRELFAVFVTIAEIEGLAQSEHTDQETW